MDLDLITADDKPALVAAATPELATTAQSALESLEYKVHSVNNHEEFSSRFIQIQYQVVVLEDRFSPGEAGKNLALAELQWMPMGQRRHATVVLVGDAFETLHTMQAFQQSVHAVVNPKDISNLAQIIAKITTDNSMFLKMYRDIQQRVATGAA